MTFAHGSSLADAELPISLIEITRQWLGIIAASGLCQHNSRQFFQAANLKIWNAGCLQHRANSGPQRGPVYPCGRNPQRLRRNHVVINALSGMQPFVGADSKFLLRETEDRW